MRHGWLSWEGIRLSKKNKLRGRNRTKQGLPDLLLGMGFIG